MANPKPDKAILRANGFANNGIARFNVSGAMASAVVAAVGFTVRGLRDFEASYMLSFDLQKIAKKSNAELTPKQEEQKEAFRVASETIIGLPLVEFYPTLPVLTHGQTAIQGTERCENFFQGRLHRNLLAMVPLA